MQYRDSTNRSITSLSGSSGTILLDMILPMWSKNDSILVSRLDNRFSIHLKVLELVQLLVFSRFPLSPSGELL